MSVEKVRTKTELKKKNRRLLCKIEEKNCDQDYVSICADETSIVDVYVHLNSFGPFPCEIEVPEFDEFNWHYQLDSNVKLSYFRVFTNLADKLRHIQLYRDTTHCSHSKQ